MLFFVNAASESNVQPAAQAALGFEHGGNRFPSFDGTSKMKRFVFELIGVIAICLFCSNGKAQIELFVATDGNDANVGTREQPLQSLQAAQVRVRELKAASPNTAITVLIRGGRYELASPLEFNAEDSGTDESPICFRAFEDEVVVLQGGPTITEFRPCPTDVAHAFPNRQHVWQIDLRGWESDDLGQPPQRSVHGALKSAHPFLVVENQMTHLARWPNAGWYTLNEVDLTKSGWSLLHGTFGSPRGTIEGSAWVHAFWENDWEDSYQSVEVRARGRSIHFNLSADAASAPRDGSRIRIENLASQLDLPGEWFIDPDTQSAFLYSEAQPTSALLARHDCAVSFYGVECFDFQDIAIEGVRNCGIEIAGGRDVRVQGCTIRHVGNTGIHIYHGLHHTVFNNSIHDCGAGGVRVEAGDRQSLEPSKHCIDKNHIFDFSHHCLAYHPGINVIGVGTSIRQNRIHHGPHAGIILYGNDHVVEGNEISHVCLETDDAGAIYLSSNPTFRGNQINENFIHDCGREGRTGIIGIYLDDFIGGTMVSGNVIQRLPRGIVVGGDATTPSLRTLWLIVWPPFNWMDVVPLGLASSWMGKILASPGCAKRCSTMGSCTPRDIRN